VCVDVVVDVANEERKAFSFRNSTGLFNCWTRNTKPNEFTRNRVVERERERERWQDEAEEESQSGAINAIMKTANREREREREANALIHHVAVMLCECHVNVIQFVMELATTKANSQTWQWHNTNNNNNNTKQARPPSSRKKEEQ